jgi:hypothetical protein
MVGTAQGRLGPSLRFPHQQRFDDGDALPFVMDQDRPCAETLSAPQMPAPPDTVRTATRSPFGNELVASSAALMVKASSRSFEMMKPYLAYTAS